MLFNYMPLAGLAAGGMTAATKTGKVSPTSLRDRKIEESTYGQCRRRGGTALSGSIKVLQGDDARLDAQEFVVASIAEGKVKW